MAAPVASPQPSISPVNIPNSNANNANHAAQSQQLSEEDTEAMLHDCAGKAVELPAINLTREEIQHVLMKATQVKRFRFQQHQAELHKARQAKQMELQQQEAALQAQLLQLEFQKKEALLLAELEMKMQHDGFSAIDASAQQQFQGGHYNSNSVSGSVGTPAVQQAVQQQQFDGSQFVDPSLYNLTSHQGVQTQQFDSGQFLDPALYASIPQQGVQQMHNTFSSVTENPDSNTQTMQQGVQEQSTVSYASPVQQQDTRVKQNSTPPTVESSGASTPALQEPFQGQQKSASTRSWESKPTSAAPASAFYAPREKGQLYAPSQRTSMRGTASMGSLTLPQVPQSNTAPSTPAKVSPVGQQPRQATSGGGNGGTGRGLSAPALQGLRPSMSLSQRLTYGPGFPVPQELVPQFNGHQYGAHVSRPNSGAFNRYDNTPKVCYVIDDDPAGVATTTSGIQQQYHVSAFNDQPQGYQPAIPITPTAYHTPYGGVSAGVTTAHPTTLTTAKMPSASPLTPPSEITAPLADQQQQIATTAAITSSAVSSIPAHVSSPTQLPTPPASNAKRPADEEPLADEPSLKRQQTDVNSTDTSLDYLFGDDSELQDSDDAPHTTTTTVDNGLEADLEAAFAELEEDQVVVKSIEPVDSSMSKFDDDFFSTAPQLSAEEIERIEEDRLARDSRFDTPFTATVKQIEREEAECALRGPTPPHDPYAAFDFSRLRDGSRADSPDPYAGMTAEQIAAYNEEINKTPFDSSYFAGYTGRREEDEVVVKAEEETGDGLSTIQANATEFPNLQGATVFSGFGGNNNDDDVPPPPAAAKEGDEERYFGMNKADYEAEYGLGTFPVAEEDDESEESEEE